MASTMQRPQHKRRPAMLIMALSIAAIPNLASAGGSLLIWPVHPILKADQGATALWLENPGDAPITMQVQSYAWAQQDGEDVYAPQKEVLASPPLVTLEPGAKQLVRITRLGPPPTEAERSYRLIVDEVPIPRSSEASNTATIAFRMRYSLPLFSYARGLNVEKGLPPPSLSWSIQKEGSESILFIHNQSAFHARMTKASIAGSAGSMSLAEGLLGYVLPASSLKVALTPEVAALQPTELTLSINDGPPTAISRDAR